MTKHGETDGFVASDFVRVIHRYLGRRVDRVVVDTGDYPSELLARYAEVGAQPVKADLETVRALAPRVPAGPVASVTGLIRHDAERGLLAIWPELAG